MVWRELLQTENETLVSPWTGGRVLRVESRSWTIKENLPLEHGWYAFAVRGRNATFSNKVDPIFERLNHNVCGYLVGNRLVPDNARVDPNPTGIGNCSERVWLIEPGLDRFVRVSAGRTHEDGPLVYKCQEMPLGPENDVLQAYLDQKLSVNSIQGVSPALDAAFRMETWHRAEVERRRIETERLRAETERLRAETERRQHLAERLGDGAGRREMARTDFSEAARAALAIGDATYLDHRQAVRHNEVAVRFRLDGQHFECTCDLRTMQVIDAGICLTDEHTGERGDSYFTLESLPAVIREADRTGRLVVYRHVY